MQESGFKFSNINSIKGQLTALWIMHHYADNFAPVRSDWTLLIQNRGWGSMSLMGNNQDSKIIRPGH